jgi:proline iminopeptidase
VGTKGPVLVVPGACWTEGDMAGGQGGDALSGHRVLFYDLRGRGRSDALPEPLAPSLGSDLADLEELRAWFGFERISLLATDYQAAVAAHYAAAHPERVERLVLVSPVPVRRTPYLKIYERVFNDRLDDEKFVELREAHVRMVNRRDPEQWARLYRDALFSGWVRDERSLDRWYSSPFVPPNADPERMIRQYMRSLETAGDWDWRPVLQRVAAPTLLIVGDDDPMPPESTREWYANLPDGRLEVISRSGRLPWVEQPGSFYSRVRSFLEGKR